MPRLTISEPQPEAGHGFDLYLGRSFKEIQIGGAGHIHGNRDLRDKVTLLDEPGTVIFDASFNTGSDVIVLGGDMRDWTVRVVGSNAVFERPGNDVWIPIGNLTWVEFEDDFAGLQFDQAQGAFTFGGQVLGADAVVPNPVISETGDPLFDPVSGNGSTYLYTNGSPVTLFALGGHNNSGFDPIFGDLGLFSEVRIFGTDGPDHVVTYSGSGLIFFDASFNRGGDTIGLPSGLPVSLSGSNAYFGLNLHGVVIPYGPNGLTIEFPEGPETLIYDTASGHVLIGDQVITAEPALLHGAPFHPFG